MSKAKYHFFRCDECRTRKKKCGPPADLFTYCDLCKDRQQPCTNTWFMRSMEQNDVKTKLAKIDMSVLNHIPNPCVVLIYQREYVDKEDRHYWFVFKQNVEATKQGCKVHVNFSTICRVDGPESLHQWLTGLFATEERNSLSCSASLFTKDQKWTSCKISAKRLSDSRTHEYIMLSWALVEENPFCDEVDELLPNAVAQAAIAQSYNNATASIQKRPISNVTKDFTLLKTVNYVMNQLLKKRGKREAFLHEIETFVRTYIPDASHGVVLDLTLPLSSHIVFSNQKHKNIIGVSMDYNKIVCDPSVFLENILEYCLNGSQRLISNFDVEYEGQKYTLIDIHLQTSLLSDDFILLGIWYDNIIHGGLAVGQKRKRGET